nr:hypothetical protein [Mycoplasmopsis bovis]
MVQNNSATRCRTTTTNGAVTKPGQTAGTTHNQGAELTHKQA